jgi:deoxycytidylate deaminase
MNVINEAIKLTYQLFPDAYADKKKGGQNFHFAFLVHRNKILSIGQNDPQKPNNKAMKFAKKFGSSIQFPYIHAEVNSISKLWGKQMITPDMKLISLRLNSYYELKSAFPCPNCWNVIDGLGIKRVYWSTKDGSIAQNF